VSFFLILTRYLWGVSKCIDVLIVDIGLANASVVYVALSPMEVHQITVPKSQCEFFKHKLVIPFNFYVKNGPSLQFHPRKVEHACIA